MQNNDIDREEDEYEEFFPTNISNELTFDISV